MVRACFGRKPDVRSSGAFSKEALPLKLERNYPRTTNGRPREESGDRGVRVDGWSAKAMPVTWVHIGPPSTKPLGVQEEGSAGLADKPRGRPAGVRKVTLAAIEEVRKLAQNPQISASGTAP